MSSLRNRMYNYEANPPSETWDKIAASLDESATGNRFPSVLYNMEATPPAAAWDSIRHSLNEKEEEKAVPLKRRTPVFLRYAAAAVFTGAIAFGVFKWTNSNMDGEAAGMGQATSSRDSNTTRLTTADSAGNEAVSLPAEEQQSADHSLLAKLDQPVRDAVRPVRIEAATDAGSNIAASEDSAFTIANRYIMLMTPEGNIIRMSKKWSDLVCCVSGEEQDEDCKLQIKKWQKKIATSPINPSPGNFMDIMELISSLDEGVEL